MKFQIVFALFLVLLVVAEFIYGQEEEVTTKRPRRRGRRRRIKPKSTDADCSTVRKHVVSKCVARAQVVGLYDFEPPKNDEEFLEFCGGIDKSYRCGLKYTKECMNGLPAQIMRLVLRALKQGQRSHCTGIRERREMLGHIQCMDPKTSGPIHDCAASMTRKVEWLASTKEIKADQIIPSLCCGVHQGMECIVNRSRTACEGLVSDPEETSEFLRDSFADVTSNMMEMLCGRYSGVSHCEEHIPEVMERFNAIDKEFEELQALGIANGTSESGESIRPDYSSMILPLMDVFERPDFNAYE